MQSLLDLRESQAPKREAPFEMEPAYCEAAGLWLYGNTRLLTAKLQHVEAALGRPDHMERVLDEIEREAERIVLTGHVLVCGIHSPAHQRASIVPLRWGGPRIVCFSGGFCQHLGPLLTEEPFRAARLWRYQWDAKTDLAISRRAPDKLPTYAHHNPTVDRLIVRISQGERIGLLSPLDTSKQYIG